VGGKLSLIVEFPDRPPVLLTGLGESEARKSVKKNPKSGPKSKPKSRRAA
jgi:hypothetical protein